MLLVFLLSACSYDDLVVDNARDQQDVLKRQYIQSSYEKAYAKMRALYPSTFANGKRMATLHRSKTASPFGTPTPPSS